MGRISPDYYVQDGVVPRTQLPAVLRRIEELSAAGGLRVGNVFHAGDGNLHPLVLYDHRVSGDAERAQALAEQILEACIDAGGSITGEHGVGTDKACSMPLLFSEADLGAMARLRRGFDPDGIANPGRSSRRRACAARCRVPTAPIRSSVQASSSASEGLVEHEPGDLTCIVLGDMPLEGLQHLLAERGQRLSLDPPGTPTVAECVLEDLAGPLRHRFGTMRDLILGVTLVLADGTRASSGGKVVKNVAGYDLGKLMCGSRGRLGAIERVALRLHPLPAHARSVSIDASRWGELHGSQLVPSAADLVGGRLHLLFEGSQRAVEDQIAGLGGEEHDPWTDIRALQATLPGRRRWEGEEAPLVRPGPRVAYTPEPPVERWSPLAEQVVEAMWTPI